MSQENLIGTQIRAYRILAEIGRGGSAAVYKAHDEKLDRLVAIKMLHAFAYHPHRQKIVERFRRGAQAAARLKHPNILPVYDFGEWQGTFYVVMQYVEGKTLRQTLLGDAEEMRPTEPLPLSLVLDIGQQVGAALTHAHERNIIHRDIKPSNILIADDARVYLTDFGLAHVEDAAPITQSGETLGTPHYMSPEQGQGLPIDHRSDIYSLGVVLFHMLTGQVPFDADTPAPVILKHMVDPLPSPRALNPDIPLMVEAVLRKALTKNPSDRYQSVQEFMHELEKAITDHLAEAADLATPTLLGPRATDLDDVTEAIDETPAPLPTQHDETFVGEPVTWDETVVGTSGGPVKPPPPRSAPKPQPSSLPEPTRTSAPDQTAELRDYSAVTNPLPPNNASSRREGVKWAVMGVILLGCIGVLACGAALFFLLGGPDLLRKAMATPTIQVVVVPTSTGAPATPTPTAMPTSELVQTETATLTSELTPTEVPPSPTAEPPTETPSPQPTNTPMPEPTDTPTLTSTPTSTTTATPTSPPPVPAGMIRIPAGDFIQGSSDAEIDAAIQMCDNAFGGSGKCPHPRGWFTDETPRRTVYLDAFYIDMWEVTNEEFADFVTATGYVTDAEKKGESQTWRTFNTPGRENFPVVWMSWNDANTYCQGVGKRLPSEAEWEKAARGADGRIWPWGSNWEPGRSNTSDGGAGSVVAVGSYPASASPYGILDMTGNVWEWVADWYDPLWYSRSPTSNPSGPPQGASRVLRGGAFGNPPWEVRAVHRHSGGATGYARDHGFRCAK